MDDDEGIWKDVDSETDECIDDGHGDDVYSTCLSAGWFGGALIISASTMISLGLLLVVMLGTCLSRTCSATMFDQALRNTLNATYANMADVRDLSWLHGNQINGDEYVIVGAPAFTTWDNPSDPTCAVPLAPYASTFKPYPKPVAAETLANQKLQNQYGVLVPVWVDKVATGIARIATSEGFGMKVSAVLLSVMCLPSFVQYMKR